MAEGDHSPSDNQEKGTWDYHPEGSATPTTVPDLPASNGSVAAPGTDSVTWTASEFIDHDKSPLWYIVLTTGTVVVCALIYLLFHDAISAIVIAILAAILGVAASRKPRIVDYRLDRGGLTIGRTFHPYGNFRSFAVVDEGAFASITLLPVKRFALPTSVYFSPEDEHIILDLLAHHLPLQPGELGVIDELMRNLHF
jgi:hypothetical protein